MILGDVPRGTTRSPGGAAVRLVLLANDVTLRNLVPGELAKGFGFFQSKPATAFSPFAVTPDELGGAWRDGRVHLPLRTTLKRRAAPRTSSAIPTPAPRCTSRSSISSRHVAHTRASARGRSWAAAPSPTPIRRAASPAWPSCARARPSPNGAPVTPFLAAGDAVAIEMSDGGGRDLFGRIAQRVVSG